MEGLIANILSSNAGAAFIAGAIFGISLWIKHRAEVKSNGHYSFADRERDNLMAEAVRSLVTGFNDYSDKGRDAMGEIKEVRLDVRDLTASVVTLAKEIAAANQNFAHALTSIIEFNKESLGLLRDLRLSELRDSDDRQERRRKVR